MLPDFLNGTGPDHQGRYLRDIWDFDDKTIEQTHDFIQWMFPLIEKSLSVPDVPTLSATDIEAIRANKVARANLERSANWYLGFLNRNDHWIKSYDHNHLRITRVIKSTRLLVGNNEADNFRSMIYNKLGFEIGNMIEAKQFWDAA